MNNSNNIQFGSKYIAKHTDQIQITLEPGAEESKLYKSLEDTGIEFLIHTISSTDCEFSVVYPKGISIKLLSEDSSLFDSWDNDYTSLTLSRRSGTRICIRLEEGTPFGEFTGFEKRPILLKNISDGKFRLSGERHWQFYRGEEYRQTLMTEPNTIPDSLNALAGVVDCEPPSTANDAKRLKGQANYAMFRIKEYMKIPMSSQVRDTLNSYVHTIGYFIGDLQQAVVRARRKPVLDDLRKDYLVEQLSKLISKNEMNELNQKATAQAMKKIKELYPDNVKIDPVKSADDILKELKALSTHKYLSAIFDDNSNSALPMNPCSDCGGRSQVRSIKNSESKATRWTVECVKCNKALDRNLWQGHGHGAVALWNKANPCDSTTLKDVPFLALGNLTKKEAKVRISEASQYMDKKSEHIKALERESTPSQRVWLNKQKGRLAFLSNLLTHARAVLAHQNYLTSGAG